MIEKTLLEKIQEIAKKGHIESLDLEEARGSLQAIDFFIHCILNNFFTKGKKEYEAPRILDEFDIHNLCATHKAEIEAELKKYEAETK